MAIVTMDKKDAAIRESKASVSVGARDLNLRIIFLLSNQRSFPIEPSHVLLSNFISLPELRTDEAHCLRRNAEFNRQLVMSEI